MGGRQPPSEFGWGVTGRRLGQGAAAYSIEATVMLFERHLTNIQRRHKNSARVHVSIEQHSMGWQWTSLDPSVTGVLSTGILFFTPDLSVPRR